MSKLSQLKQDAYQAGKDRNWDQAISIYEQILEIDKKNPTLVNELGDICLKASEVSRGVRHFLNAASLYRKNGLVNNAVAIYKKILRHDADNMNAHWYLAESRAGQGLKAEGQTHALTFLNRSGNVAGELKEIYLKRCLTLLDLYYDSEETLEKLIQVFRMWEMFLEAGRAEILVCCLKFAQDGASMEAKVDEVVDREPTMVNYPEYSRWRQLVNPQEQPAADSAFADFGTVDLANNGVGDAPPTNPIETADPSPKIRDEASFGDLALDVPQAPPVPAADETSFAGLGEVEIPVPAAPPASESSFGGLMDDDGSPRESDHLAVDIDPLKMEKDEEGCISIDTGNSGDLNDILAAAVDQIGTDVAANRVETAVVPEVETTPAEGTVNLLDQILADGDSDFLGTESQQLETITAEIGSQVGGDDEDQPDRQYEMGLVYLEMGMLDQAITSFKAASTDADYAARAYEMWSMALERNQRLAEALAVLRQGVADETVDRDGQLGLLYHLGKLLEQAQEPEEAGKCYEQIMVVDPEYMDVTARRNRLPVTT